MNSIPLIISPLDNCYYLLLWYSCMIATKNILGLGTFSCDSVFYFYYFFILDPSSSLF